MKRILFFAVLLAIGMVYSMQSCKKDRITKDDIEAAQDNALASGLFDDAFKQTMKASEDADDQVSGEKSYSADSSRLPACATLSISSIDPNTWPKTLTVDFGTENSTCSDLKQRRGKILVNHSAPWRDESSVHTVTFEDFYVDDNKLTGTKTITNMGQDEQGRSYFKIVVVNAVITTPEGETISWASTRYRYWLKGEETTLWTDGLEGITDDEYGIVGSSDGTTRSGKEYSITIKDTIKAQVGCRWIKAGVLEIAVDGDDTPISVDYGDGTCDAKATATIGENTFEFYMK